MEEGSVIPPNVMTSSLRSASISECVRSGPAPSTLKVTLVAASDPSLELRTGSGRLLKLARLLRTHGVQTNLAIPSSTPGETKLHGGVPLSSYARSGSFLHPVGRDAPWNPIGEIPRILADRPDLVIVGESRALPFALLLGSVGVPVVMDLSGADETAGTPFSYDGKDTRWRTSFTHLSAREPEGIVVDSDAARQLLIRRHGAHPGRVLLIPHGLGEGPATEAAVGEAVVWIAPFEPPRAREALQAFEAAELLMLKHSRPGVRIIVVVPEGTKVRPQFGVEVRTGEMGLQSALGEARMVLSTGRTEASVLVTATRRGVPVCGFPEDATRADRGSEGMLIGISAGANVRNATRLLDDALEARRLGLASVRAWNADLRHGDIMPQFLALLNRARRAWVDPVQKLGVLGTLRGRWPKRPDDVARYVASWRFRPSR
jgi:hypothetical protein